MSRKSRANSADLDDNVSVQHSQQDPSNTDRLTLRNRWRSTVKHYFDHWDLDGLSNYFSPEFELNSNCVSPQFELNGYDLPLAGLVGVVHGTST